MDEQDREKFEQGVQDIINKMKWTVIDGDVYDITNYIKMHPGGVKKINLGVGKDSTVMFHKFHKGIRLELTPLPGLKFGEIPSLKEQAISKDKKEAPNMDSKKSDAKPQAQAQNSNMLQIPGLKIGIL